ncbi:MAG: hypothetical protein ACXWQO_03560 [Bdellovibrionota bacterium]
MKTFALLSALFLGSVAANACQLSTANITGIGVGAQFKNGTCYVDVEIEKVSYSNTQCRMALRPEQKIRIMTDLTEMDCPLDETHVNGTVSSGGQGGYLFTGRVH